MNINYGFEKDKFYIDYVACSRPAGNMREESDRRAKELYEKYNGQLTLAFSSGIDSQAVLHSFVDQGLPIKTVFKHMPGFNDNELDNIKILDNKYGITTDIVDVDVMSIQQKLEEEELDTGIQIYSLLWKHFISLLPKDINFVQMAHDPYVHLSTYNKQRRFIMSWNGPDISKDKAYQLIKKDRTGDYIFYGDTPEFLYSILNDDTYRAAMHSVEYFTNNGLKKDKVDLTTLDRWDYYIKPIIYGKYWKSELEYFSKFVGFKNISYLTRPPEFFKKYPNMGFFTHCITPVYEEFIDFLGQNNGEVKRFYQQFAERNGKMVKL
jgi:hypothetical protein